MVDWLNFVKDNEPVRVVKSFRLGCGVSYFESKGTKRLYGLVKED